MPTLYRFSDIVGTFPSAKSWNCLRISSN